MGPVQYCGGKLPLKGSTPRASPQAVSIYYYILSLTLYTLYVVYSINRKCSKFPLMTSSTEFT